MESDERFLQVFSDLDRHFGRLMEKFSGRNNPAVFLAAALTSRSCRKGHVCLDLPGCAGKPVIAEVQEDGPADFIPDIPEGLLPVCPSLSSWQEILRASPVVGRPGEYKPLILDDDGRLYLYRYWFYEDLLIRFLEGCADSHTETDFREAEEPVFNWPELEESLHRVFPGDWPTSEYIGKKFEEPFPDMQRIAALAVLRKRFVVISGSPGTGKTTAAARILALLQRLKRGSNLRIALAAPTGKAAIRLEEAMKKACGSFSPEFQPEKAMTLHRLLGVIPGSPYFRHNPDNPLPYDLVVVDEASMVDLPLMAKLVSALYPTSRLLLLGDRDQLASVEAGAVLGDLCGLVEGENSYSPAFLENIGKIAGVPFVFPKTAGPQSPLADSIIFLRKNYRFDKESGIGQLSSAVNQGNFEGALSILKSAHFADIGWQVLPESQNLGLGLKNAVLSYFKEYLQAVRNSEDLERLFTLFERFRILCAFRRGSFGVLAVNVLLENLLRSEGLIYGDGRWYPGRPVMITQNDYALELFNGDVGLTLPDRTDGGLSVFFRDPEKGFRHFAPFRLPEHESVYAMTIHKSQGSEFDEVLMLLSDRETPLLTRELVYTGVTRAKKRLSLWGREDSLRKAISRRTERISGLRSALRQFGCKETT
ncbi:DNA helicase/exodeoxyribonuclease V, alpha subunit [Syntrophus gentianae]|uniref:DNA helicase/exodeoxyribonuclease V, alpha subunit n=1 Tax=Syntrophus gentianae TaxID=43775 RepID=A0A1H7W033_9BACT|nr:exodeoxyribonuclease V subunit alpha [Syntrophus gentianae]SEM14435.1 DNA helicase/exodeoxyribonuclease V, alpha subunit [Syntrophus gentianae]